MPAGFQSLACGASKLQLGLHSRDLCRSPCCERLGARRRDLVEAQRLHHAAVRHTSVRLGCRLLAGLPTGVAAPLEQGLEEAVLGFLLPLLAAAAAVPSAILTACVFISC